MASAGVRPYCGDRRSKALDTLVDGSPFGFWTAARRAAHALEFCGGGVASWGRDVRPRRSRWPAESVAKWQWGGRAIRLAPEDADALSGFA